MTALLSLPAAAVPAAPLLANIPLPGYSPILMETRSAARPDASFPSASKIFGHAADPLSTLTVGPDEDLKDSLNSPPAAMSLQAGLRQASLQSRLSAIQNAARPRYVEAVPYLSGVMLRMDQPTQLRAAAALGLGFIGDRVAVPALSEAMKDPSPEVRYAAALSLGHLPADGVATRLERTLRSDPSWGPRYAAAIALGRTHKAFAADALADALTSDPAWQVRQQAARSLQDLATPHAAEALASALNDPEPSVRAAAGAGLAEIGGPQQRLAVAQALRAETDPSVRAVLSAAERRALTRS